MHEVARLGKSFFFIGQNLGEAMCFGWIRSKIMAKFIAGDIYVAIILGINMIVNTGMLFAMDVPHVLKIYPDINGIQQRVDAQERGVGLDLPGLANISPNLPTAPSLHELQFDDARLILSLQAGVQLTPLQRAVVAGTVDEVKEKIESENLDILIESNGGTLLHLAAFHGQCEVLDFLVVSSGMSSVDVRDMKKQTPMHWAASNGQDKIIQQLIALGSNIELSDRGGFKPIHMASTPEIVRQLLKAGANISTNTADLAKVRGFRPDPLTCAVRKGYAAVVQMLISAGAAVKREFPKKECDERGFYGLVDIPPLFFAARCGHLEVIRVLVSEGAEVNVKVHNLLTALHYAAQGGVKDIVEELIKVGAHVDARDKDGRTPLHYACSSGAVNALIDNKANVEAVDKLGYMPIHNALALGNTELVRKLLSNFKKPALVMTRDDDNTLLHHAISHYFHRGNWNVCWLPDVAGLPTPTDTDYIELIRLLISLGLNIYAKNKAGLTPLDLARADMKMVECLLLAHANV